LICYILILCTSHFLFFVFKPKTPSEFVM